MIDENRKSALGHLAALGTILIWGTTYVATKVLLQSFTPVEILFTRFIIGYIALLIFYPHRLKTKDYKEELLLMAAGITGITLFFLLENIALMYTLASNVGIIVSISPLITAVFAHFLLSGEKLKPQFFAGFVIALVGIVLIGFNGSFVLKLNPLGDFLAALAAAVWAIYSVIMRKISQFGYNTIACTRRSFLYGLIFMLPALFFMKFNLDLNRFTDMKIILNFLFLSLGASATCFATWNWAVGVLGAVKTSFYIYIIPVVTIISSALILHERITLLAFSGAVLTLSGLFISERKAIFKTRSLENENGND